MRIFSLGPRDELLEGGACFFILVGPNESPQLGDVIEHMKPEKRGAHKLPVLADPEFAVLYDVFSSAGENALGELVDDMEEKRIKRLWGPACFRTV